MSANATTGGPGMSADVRENGWSQQGSGFNDPQGPPHGCGLDGAVGETAWQLACAGLLEEERSAQAAPQPITAARASTTTEVARCPPRFTVPKVVGCPAASMKLISPAESGAAACIAHDGQVPDPTGGTAGRHQEAVGLPCLNRGWRNEIDSILMREFAALQYIDPEAYLRKLRGLEIEVARSDLLRKIRHLRTHALKPMRERRGAAILAYGMQQVTGSKVFVSAAESSDYDCIMAWTAADGRHFCPVQLKEWVPSELNPNATLDNLVQSLSRKYPTSRRTVVAVEINRRVTLDIECIKVPPLSIAELWFFGAISDDQSEWMICGNMLNVPRMYRFAYPWP